MESARVLHRSSMKSARNRLPPDLRRREIRRHQHRRLLPRRASRVRRPPPAEHPCPPRLAQLHADLRERRPGDSASWHRCLAAWGFTEAQALAFGGNPVDNLKPLADARIPLLLVCGDIEVIHKPGAGHHPHSLVDPQPIVDFILRHR